MELKIQNLVGNRECYEAVRRLRWPHGVKCPQCGSSECVKKGFDETQSERQRYACKACQQRFDDLTLTVFAGHHQPLKTWILFLYFLGLNLSTSQIAQELGLNKDDAQSMAEVLRSGVVENKPKAMLSGIVECDEVYVVAGHKGNPTAVQKKSGKDAGIG